MNKLDRETTKPLFCEFCGEIFSESSAISPHFCHQEDAKSSEHQLKRKMSDGHVRLFDCGDCGLQCASKESLSTHRRYHSNQKRPKLNHSQLKNRKIHECLCPKCGIMVPSRFFGRHMKDEHPESPVKLWSVTDLSCDICSITLSSKSHLLAHIARFHEGSEFFSCPECSKVFQSREKLEAHLDCHTKAAHSALECIVCGKKNESEWQLCRHVATHRRNGAISCKKCSNKTFLNLKSLIAHQRVHFTGKVSTDKKSTQLIHEQGPRAVPSKTLLESFQCQSCRIQFHSEIAIKNHKNRVHCLGQEKNVSLKCPLCLQSFMERELLLSHIGSNHNPAKTLVQPVLVYKCNFCSRVLASLEAISDHYQSAHTD